jgi:Flp pilus assembly protein TadG
MSMSRIAKFAKDRRGAFAMQFALMITPLVICTGLAIDGGRIFLARFELAHALDAAALAIGSTFDDDVDLDELAQTFVDKNFRHAGTGAVTTELQELDDGETITLSGSVTVNTFFMPIVGMAQVPVSAVAEVKRGGADVEVALILDTTGSMAGTPLADLKDAAGELIDIVVSDDQSVWYSRVGVVPYSNSVYAGTYAAAARGSIPTSKSITGATWKASGASQLTSVTFNATTDVFTKASHGLANNDYVFVEGMSGSGNSIINGKAWKVANVSGNQFELKDTAGTKHASSSTGSSGKMHKCANDWCQVQITANGHGFSNDQWVHITSVGGLTSVNNKTFQLRAVATNTFIMKESLPLNTSTNYSSGGNAWCSTYGCQYYRFERADSNYETLQASDCVVERTGSKKYTDDAPNPNWVTIHYPQGDSNLNCYTGNVLRPMSDSPDTIKSNINALSANGSTAGHIGLAWGWYMLSPNWNSVFSGATYTAGAYETEDLVKVAVMMTDGEFNTTYCNGVLANDAGFSSNSNQAKCNAPNGGAFDQAEDLCEGMKTAGITIYTVGFNITDGSDEDEFLEDCASEEDYYHLANSGDELTEAFQAIARSITLLRLSK